MSDSFIRIAKWQTDMADIMRIREAVFINEQNIPPEQEWDDHDETAIHFLAVDGQYPMGTARLYIEDPSHAVVSRVAVLKDWRDLHIGAKLLEALIEKADALNIKTLSLTAQKHAKFFYERFGFTQSSDEFLEVGIPHIEMVRQS